MEHVVEPVSFTVMMIKTSTDFPNKELLRDDDPITPIKKVGIKKKERPTDEGVSWLMKIEYISPLTSESAKQHAKELRETRGGRNILEDLNDRNMQIQEIEASFEASKSRPVHATNRKLQPVKVQPLFPDFDRNQFVLTNFDGAPTADSEDYNKFDKTLRDAYESRAIMKSFEASSSIADKPGKMLAYMVPAPNELSKDMYDENEDISYSKVREYHWDVCTFSEYEADDPTTYADGVWRNRGPLHACSNNACSGKKREVKRENQMLKSNISQLPPELQYGRTNKYCHLRRRASANAEGLLEPLCSTKIGIWPVYILPYQTLLVELYYCAV
ncbi:hypothetical protein P3S67_031906 [Capsicum chacoense]